MNNGDQAKQERKKVDFKRHAFTILNLPLQDKEILLKAERATKRQECFIPLSLSVALSQECA
jgi:hypothetical protein